MLISRACLYSELKVFSTSTSKTASVLFGWMDSSLTNSILTPPHKLRLVTAVVTSSLGTPKITFPLIRLQTSPTPIGLKPEFLPNGSLYAKNDSNK